MKKMFVETHRGGATDFSKEKLQSRVKNLRSHMSKGPFLCYATRGISGVKKLLYDKEEGSQDF